MAEQDYVSTEGEFWQIASEVLNMAKYDITMKQEKSVSYAPNRLTKIDNNTLAVQDGNDTIHILDVTDPTNITELSSVSSTTINSDMTVNPAGDRLYAFHPQDPSNDANAYVIDISDYSNASIINNSVTQEDEYDAVAHIGNDLIVSSDQLNGVKVMELDGSDDPSNWTNGPASYPMTEDAENAVRDHSENVAYFTSVEYYSQKMTVGAVTSSESTTGNPHPVPLDYDTFPEWVGQRAGRFMTRCGDITIFGDLVRQVLQTFEIIIS